MLTDLKQQLLTQKIITLTIKVTPKSGKHEIAGIMANGRVKIKLKSAPEKGKANEELIELLSEYFGVPRKNIILKIGGKSKEKVVTIHS